MIIKKALGSLLVLFIFSYIIASIVIGLIFDEVGNPPKEVVQVEPISSRFDSLDSRVFNDKSLNPTQLIEIRESDGGSVFSRDQDSNEPSLDQEN